MQDFGQLSDLPQLVLGPHARDLVQGQGLDPERKYLQKQKRGKDILTSQVFWVRETEKRGRETDHEVQGEPSGVDPPLTSRSGTPMERTDFFQEDVPNENLQCDAWSGLSLSSPYRLRKKEGEEKGKEGLTCQFLLNGLSR